MHNEIARKYRPDNTQVLYNKKYLEGVLGLQKAAETGENHNGLVKNGEERDE